MTDPRPTILPTGSTALERAVDQSAPRWDTLAAAAHPLDGRHPEPFKPWLAAEWALAEFARYFDSTDELIAAALPWLMQRGTAAAVQCALGWLGYTNATVDQDGAWLHIDPGRLVTPALSGSILEGVTRASILQLGRDRGLRVEERKVSVDEWKEGKVLRHSSFEDLKLKFRFKAYSIEDGYELLYMYNQWIVQQRQKLKVFIRLLGTEVEPSESIQAVIERAEQNEREKYLEMDVDVIFTLHDIRDTLDKLFSMETLLKELEVVCRKRSAQIIAPVWEAKGSL